MFTFVEQFKVFLTSLHFQVVEGDSFGRCRGRVLPGVVDLLASLHHAVAAAVLLKNQF